jgi:hypothetical protein
MAIRYVDLLNGNDANDGTTFALRKKTFSSASTGLTAGDTIRVMKSPDATSLGNCTWSSTSKNITLAAPVTANICTCETAWTASTNVTCTTATLYYRQGTVESSIAIAAGFTTGKVAYFTTGALDLSAYQQISFFMRNNAALPANSLYLDLCSDTTGDVPVASFLIQQLTGVHNNRQYPYTMDFGSALPAGINSIAIRAVSDPGTITLVFDNIIACKAPSAADSLTLNSIVGLNTADEPEWFPIRYIDGTTVSILINCFWKGSTGSLTTYKMEPLRIFDITGAANLPTSDSATFPAWSLNTGGQAIAFLNIECGYDSTNMTTQTGYTAVDFQLQLGKGGPGDRDFINLNKFISVRSNYAIYGYSSGTLKLGEYHNVGGLDGTFVTNTLYGDKVYITCNINQTSGTGSFLRTSTFNTLVFKYLYRELVAEYFAVESYFNSLDTYIDKLVMVGYRSGIQLGLFNGLINNAYGTAGENSTSSFVFKSNASAGGCNVRINNLFNYNTTLGGIFYLNVGNYKISVGNYTSPETTAKLAANSGNLQDNSNYFIQNYRGTGLSKGVNGTVAYEHITTPVHTAGGIAWQLSCTNYDLYKNIYDVDYYKFNKLKIGDIPVKANKLTTVKIWTQRLYTTTKLALYVRPDGPISSFIVAESSAAANTWEELTITFTPTSTGVLPVYIGVQYDATNAGQLFYFDDFSVTIAD